MGHKVSKEQIEKDKLTWKNKYIDSMIKIAELKQNGLKWKEISGKLGISMYTAINRFRKYKRSYCGK